jgi:hypothetical protein
MFTSPQGQSQRASGAGAGLGIDRDGIWLNQCNRHPRATASPLSLEVRSAAQLRRWLARLEG